MVISLGTYQLQGSSLCGTHAAAYVCDSHVNILHCIASPLLDLAGQHICKLTLPPVLVHLHMQTVPVCHITLNTCKFTIVHLFPDICVRYGWTGTWLLCFSICRAANEAPLTLPLSDGIVQEDLWSIEDVGLFLQHIAEQHAEASESQWYCIIHYYYVLVPGIILLLHSFSSTLPA